MSFLSALENLDKQGLVRVQGRVVAVTGVLVEAEGLSLPVGAECEIVTRAGCRSNAEVVAFSGERTHLLPESGIEGIGPRDTVIHDGDVPSIPVSEDLLGRVIDARGNPIDGLGPISNGVPFPIHNEPIQALRRCLIDQPVKTGVRAVDGVLTAGRGQRLGIFSGSGVGKSTLMGMISRNTELPVKVIALIGERGREVREFIERDLGPEGLRNSVVVVATSDEAAVLRIRAAKGSNIHRRVVPRQGDRCPSDGGLIDQDSTGPKRSWIECRGTSHHPGIYSQRIRHVAETARKVWSR